MKDKLKDQLEYGELLDDIRRYVAIASEHNLLDSLACRFHNDGHGLNGNTAAKDGYWLAREMYREMHHGDGRFDDCAAGEKEHWTRLAESAIRCMPGLMSRIANRCIQHSEVLRSVERAMREDRKKAGKKIGVER